MSDLKRIVDNLQSAFAESSYPADFLSVYDQMECLASHQGRETFLVRDRTTGRNAVAKCFDRSVYRVTPLLDVLRELKAPGLPAFLACYQNEKMFCVVREYVEGESLLARAGEAPIPPDEIRRIGLSLCDTLSVLHAHRPPVIHRDIKPDNVILREDGSVVLIDFDIARMFRDGSENDTFFFGTRGYAPPEQYGFAQTDQRADIYAFGVLLRYLLTGSTRENPNVTLPDEFRTVIGKCTAFAPEDRYASIDEVKQALLAKPRRKRFGAKALLALLAALLLGLCGGFAVRRYTGLFLPPPAVAHFDEPLIGLAARAVLGLREDEPVPLDRLKEIRRIYIFGTKVYPDDSIYYQLTIDNSIRGGIRTLNDLLMMPNLEEVHIDHQDEIDISALAQLRSLYTVELKHVRIADITPLGSLTGLKHATLFDCGAEDFTSLAPNRWLETLDIGLTPVVSLARVGAYPSVTELTLMWLRMASLDGLEGFPKVRILRLEKAQIDDYSAILLLPELETVTVDGSQYETVSALLKDTDVQVQKTVD